MSRSCALWKKKLAATRIDQLPLEDQEALWLHMQTCRACFALYTEYLVIDNCLQNMYAKRTLLRVIDASRPSHVRKSTLFLFRSSRPRWLSVAALISAIGLIMAFFFAFIPLMQGTASNHAQAASLDFPQSLPISQPGVTWVRTVSWSPNGKYIAVLWDNNTVEVLNADMNQEVFVHDVATGDGLAWSPDSLLLASVGRAENTTIQIWNLATHQCEQNAAQQCLIYTGHTGKIEAIAWSPDGQYIASASDDGTVQVWDAYTLQRLQRYLDPGSEETAVAWSHRGTRIVFGDDEGRIQALDALSGFHPVSYLGHQGAITSVSWSANDTSIASSSYDGTVRIWNAPIGTLLEKFFPSQGSPVFAAIWAPWNNRTYLAVACYNGSVQVWNIGPTERVATHGGSNLDGQSHNGYFTISWSPLGNRLVSGGRGQVLTFRLGN